MKDSDIQIFNEVANKVLEELKELFFEYRIMTVEDVEMTLVRNLVKRFPQKQAADILGLSPRSIRLKMNGK